MVATFPSAHSVYVPSHEASGKLVVDFSRNASEFAINRYVQIVPVKKMGGYYMHMTVEEAGRILNADGAEFDWPDGAEAPEDRDGTESFNFLEFRAKRRKYGYRMGDLTVDQAEWDIVAQHGAIKAQQAMTFRSQTVATVAQTAGNYDATHTADVTAITGNSGQWPASTTARQDIKRSLNHGADVINKDTLGKIKPSSLILVLSPTLAREISECQEIVDYIKGSPDAYAYVKGELANQNENIGFGLPPSLYGYKVVVEDAVKVTSRKGATKVTARVWDAAKPLLCARPGALEGLYGAPSFSTISIFMLEEMTVETMKDQNHRLTRGRVVENFDTKLVAPVSGFLFTNAT